MNKSTISNDSNDSSLRQFAKMTVGQCDRVVLHSYLSEGNTKLPSSTAIFNMGTARECPSKKLGFCQAIGKDGKHCCYALKAEIQYPAVLPYRKKQENFWKRISAEKFVMDFLLINAMKVKPFTALRVNESGDFWSQGCVDKLDKIAGMLGKFGVTVYCYTSRQDLDFSKVKHIIISGSNFQKSGISNIFKMICKGDEKPTGYGECVGDCRKCKRCMVRGMKTVILGH